MGHPEEEAGAPVLTVGLLSPNTKTERLTPSEDVLAEFTAAAGVGEPDLRLEPLWPWANHPPSGNSAPRL